MSGLHRRLQLALLLALTVTGLLVSPASAATVSDRYSISGAEYYATATQGRFAGTAGGSSNDSATWNAVVDHTPLSTTATITGGYADLFTSNFVRVQGSFSGGTVALASEEAGCGRQTYEVVGALTKVTRSDSHRKGTGTFAATLTHYRTSVFGSCITYSARVSGTITLSF